MSHAGFPRVYRRVYQPARPPRPSVTTALVKDAKLLTVTCLGKVQPIAYSLDEPAQVSVAVRFGSGTTEYCTVFGGTVAKDKTKKNLARNTAAPATCPVPPATCP
jgi:hypothetical protein